MVRYVGQAEKFSESKKKVFRDAFRLFDKDGDGQITADEIRGVMKELHVDLSLQEVDSIISDIDKDGDRKIDFDEFLAMMADKVPEDEETAARHRLIDAFKVFDRDGNGYISPEELHQVMGALGQPMTLEEAEKMVKDADSEGVGMINYQDFVTKLCRASHAGGT